MKLDGYLACEGLYDEEPPEWPWGVKPNRAIDEQYRKDIAAIEAAERAAWESAPQVYIR